MNRSPHFGVLFSGLFLWNHSDIDSASKRSAWKYPSWGLHLVVSSYLRKDADGAGDPEKDSVKVSLSDAVILQKNSRMSIYIGPRVLDLHTAPKPLLMKLWWFYISLKSIQADTRHCPDLVWDQHPMSNMLSQLGRVRIAKGYWSPSKG